jgi:hypothetical protein
VLIVAERPSCLCRVNFSQTLYVLGNIFLLLVTANAVTYPLLPDFLQIALVIPVLITILNLGGCGCWAAQDAWFSAGTCMVRAVAAPSLPPICLSRKSNTHS